MKKITIIGIAVAIAMGFTACQKEIDSTGHTTGNLITETFSATIDQTVTKTATNDGGSTVTWAANDKVHYYTADGGTLRDFTISSAGNNATITLERGTSDTYYNLIYAGSTTPTFTAKTSSSMVFDGVKTAQDGSFTNANVSVGRTTPGGNGITFKPVTALVKFTTSRTDIKTIVLTGGAGTEKVAGNISVDPTATSPIGTLSGDGSTSITTTIATPAAGTYYINVLPATYSNGLKMTLKNSSGAVLGTVTASKSIDLSAGGKMINLGNIDSHIVVDLSLAGTANCYIVSSPGNYKFKAVKGNSDTSAGDVKYVKVLWESYGTETAPAVGDLINATVSYADGYITFTTGSKFSTKKGNAVIAAYSSDNSTVLWSWHIWCTSEPVAEKYYSNAGFMMDRNLGATSTTPGNVGALGLLYQWGRKDPFLGSSSISSNTKALSTDNYLVSIWTRAKVADNSSENDTNLKASISNPTNFIYYTNDYVGDWYSSTTTNMNNNLWSSTKTIYDPCPYGWKVPNINVWSTAFGTETQWTNASNWNSTHKGMDLANIEQDRYIAAENCWYPAAGIISAYNSFPSSEGGVLTYVGYEGHFWSCTTGTSSTYKAYCLKIASNGNINPQVEVTRGEARSVRCIKQ